MLHLFALGVTTLSVLLSGSSCYNTEIMAEAKAATESVFGEVLYEKRTEKDRKVYYMFVIKEELEGGYTTYQVDWVRDRNEDTMSLYCDKFGKYELVSVADMH